MVKYASPRNFYLLADKLIPWLAGITILLMTVGVYQALFVAPPDYQQGETVRIMFVHVPSAWMSMFIYASMAAAGGAGLVWHTKLAHMFASACAPIGASFTLLALLTGSLWGAPMWGTWWEWDARMTSELLLLFLFTGYMTLRASIDDPQRADRAAAILALVGAVDLPVIHFSVEWWNTLHQPASVGKVGVPSIHKSILIPLLVMMAAFNAYFFTVVLIRVRNLIIQRERHTRWIAEIIGVNK